MLLVLSGCRPQPTCDVFTPSSGGNPLESGLPYTTPDLSDVPEVLLFGGTYGDASRPGPGFDPGNPDYDPTLPNEALEATLPHLSTHATALFPYPGSKRGQAENARPYHSKDVIIIGYSGGADAALFYAYDYMNENPSHMTNWNIKGLALLGPTFTGTMSDGTIIGDNPSRSTNILDRLLLGGTSIYWLDDAFSRHDLFRSYSPPSSISGYLKKSYRPDLAHHNSDKVPATNTDPGVANDIFAWFGLN